MINYQPDRSNDDAKCPLCGSGMRSPRTYAKRTFQHCSSCDLISVPSRNHLDEAAERDRYLLHQNSSADAGYIATFDGPIRCLSTYAPDARRVLDYGCGQTPVLVELLRERGYDAVGYDPLFSPNLENNTRFDAIVCVETAEHFRAPRADLEKMHGLLSARGCLIVKTHLHGGPESIDGWWYARDMTHVAFYSRATFEWIAQRFGLDIVECDSLSLVCFRKRSS